MKKTSIIMIVILMLVSALAGCVQQPVASPSPEQTPEIAAGQEQKVTPIQDKLLESVPEENNLTYCNKEGGWQITFPESWKGLYEVEEYGKGIDVNFGTSGNSGVYSRMFKISTDKTSENRVNLGTVNGVKYYAYITDSSELEFYNDGTDQTNRDINKYYEMQQECETLLETFRAIDGSIATKEPDPDGASFAYFSEIDSKLGRKNFSVNNLAKTFGQPKEVYGVYYGESSGTFGIIAEFEGAVFSFTAENGKLSFDNEDFFNAVDYEQRTSMKIEVTESDLNLKMFIFNTTVSSNECPLPRGIKIGDDMQKVISAYPSEFFVWYDSNCIGFYYEYEKDVTGNSKSVFDMSEDGGIYYTFEDNKLVEADIVWITDYMMFD